MTTGHIVFAVVCAAVGALFLYARSRYGREIAIMQATPTSRAADAVKMTPGTLVEVKGMFRCQAPLTSEFSKQACVYHKSELIREYTYFQRDSQGRQQRRTGSETMQANERRANCYVEDASGSILVRLEGAEIEAAEVVNRLEPPQANLGDLISAVTHVGQNTTGYRYRETMLGIGVPAYVLGEVQPDGAIGAPQKGSSNTTFIVSHKTEEERAASLQSWRTITLVGGLAAFALGIGGLILPYVWK